MPGRPAVHPMSLLTTATALGQQSAQWKDSTGRQFHVDDHRRVYVFRHDPDRTAYTPHPGKQPPAGVEELFTPSMRTDLKAANADVVAPRAVRATAGFPGAFAPPVDEGGLHRFCLTPGTPVAKLVDGGVLDNAPFEPLLAEVARREVNGPWQRVIGYVVANDGLETLPNGEPALDAVGVLSAALRMPAETSFRDGVEALARRSLDAERLVSGPEALFSQLLVDGVDLKVLEPIYTVYRRVRTESGLLDARAVRHADVRSVTMQSLPTVDPDAAAPWVPGADLAEAVRPGEFVWGTAVADRSVRLLLRHLHQDGGDHDAALQHLSALTTLSPLCVNTSRRRSGGRCTSEHSAVASGGDTTMSGAGSTERPTFVRLLTRAPTRWSGRTPPTWSGSRRGGTAPSPPRRPCSRRRASRLSTSRRGRRISAIWTAAGRWTCCGTSTTGATPYAASPPTSCARCCPRRSGPPRMARPCGRR